MNPRTYPLPLNFHSLIHTFFLLCFLAGVGIAQTAGVVDRDKNGWADAPLLGYALNGNDYPFAPLDTGDVVNVIPAPGSRCQGLTWDGANLWVSDIFTQTLYQLDPSNGAVLHTIPSPGNYVEGLAWDGAYLWAMDNGGGPSEATWMYKLDPTNGQVLHFFVPTRNWPHGITFDGTYLWTNDFSTHLIDQIDPQNGQVLATIPSPGQASIGLTWDGSHLWSDDFNDNKLYRLDPSDGTIVQEIPSPATNPRDMAWDGQYLWVVYWQSAQIYQIDPGFVTAIDREPLAIQRFFLEQNYPNPFNPSTTVRFRIADFPEGASRFVQLKIFDQSGKTVKTLLNEERAPGSYAVQWNGTDDSGNAVSSGVYYYQLRAGQYQQTRKMLLVR